MEAITLHTIEEVAEILRISVASVYRLAQQGELQGTKVAKQWRFSNQDIHEYLAKARGQMQAA